MQGLPSKTQLRARVSWLMEQKPELAPASWVSFSLQIDPTTKCPDGGQQPSAKHYQCAGFRYSSEVELHDCAGVERQEMPINFNLVAGEIDVVRIEPGHVG